MHSMTHETTPRWPDPAIRIYTRSSLPLYDAVVMRLLSDWVWGCPAEHFLAHYRRHLTANHAEIGVGSGYCLDRCGFPEPNPRLALIDLQPNCLAYSARRLARYRPKSYVHDARDPMWLGLEPFDSVAICGVLHCLPGSLSEKGKVFDALAPLAAAGTTIFGYTLVSDNVRERALPHAVHRLLNRLQIIANREDRRDDLYAELARRFDAPAVEQIGCLAFFSAVVPGGSRHA